MAKPTLDDALDKLRWARHHFDLLRPELQTLEESDTHTISFKLDAQAGKYTFYIDGLKEPDPDLGLIVGDCLHNARTALDYLMVRIYALVSGEEPGTVEGVQFPIYDRPERFKSAVGRFTQYPMASGYLTCIEQLQSYNNGNPSVWGIKNKGAFTRLHALPNALDRLSTLDNIDKHRVTHAVWSQVDFLGSLSSGGLQYPADFTLSSQSTNSGPLENGAEVGHWTFETPLPPPKWHPGEMDMKCAFPIQVAIGEPPEMVDALKVLALCLWGVEAVLTLFAPVFAELKPPLPVTAIPNLDWP